MDLQDGMPAEVALMAELLDGPRAFALKHARPS